MTHDPRDERSRSSVTLTPLSLVVLTILIGGVVFVLLEVLL